MYTQVVILACLCSALVYALPVPESAVPQENIDLVQIPLNEGKELDILTLGESGGELSERNKRTIGILRQLFPELSKNGGDSIDMAALNEQLQETIRVARQTQVAQQVAEQANPAENETGSNDQQVSESKAPAIDELTLDAEEPEITDDDRNKRFLNLSFGGSGGGSPTGGSGNFLFDIIRRTADRAARAAGTVYRVVAGTESLDLNDTGSKQKLTTTTTKHQQLLLQPQDSGLESGLSLSNNDRTSRTFNDGLFSGSVSTQQTDEKSNSPFASDDSATATVGGDGYTEGIPGPVTRLFVLANRGIANLIQDLILRIAQTSERIVNFKARLITSLI